MLRSVFFMVFLLTLGNLVYAAEKNPPSGGEKAVLLAQLRLCKGLLVQYKEDLHKLYEKIDSQVDEDDESIDWEDPEVVKEAEKIFEDDKEGLLEVLTEDLTDSAGKQLLAKKLAFYFFRTNKHNECIKALEIISDDSPVKKYLRQKTQKILLANLCKGLLEESKKISKTMKKNNEKNKTNRFF